MTSWRNKAGDAATTPCQSRSDDDLRSDALRYRLRRESEHAVEQHVDDDNKCAAVCARGASLHWDGHSGAVLATLPLDLSLFFRLPGGGDVARPNAIFEVSGGYNTGLGSFTGSIRGTLDGTAESGIFTGELSANLANGCIATRNYVGPITRQSVSWTAGAITNDCAGASPLTFGVTAQATTSPPTTSSTSTTTTTVPGVGVTGRWSGVLTDAEGEAGQYEFNLVQSGNTVSGSHIPLDLGVGITFSSAITGTIAGTTLTFSDRWTVGFTQPEVATCTTTLSFSVQLAANTMAGTYSTIDIVCTSASLNLSFPFLGRGTFSAARQSLGNAHSLSVGPIAETALRRGLRRILESRKRSPGI